MGRSVLIEVQLAFNRRHTPPIRSMSTGSSFESGMLWSSLNLPSYGLAGELVVKDLRVRVETTFQP